MKSRAKKTFETVSGVAKDLVMTQIDRRSTDLGNAIGARAGNVRMMSKHLRSDGREPTAKLTDAAAERLSAASEYLINSNADRIVSDVERVARKRPIATAGFGLLCGLFAARILKSGARERYAAAAANSSEDSIS